MFVMWGSVQNILGVDFELYNSYSDLLTGSNKWTYCNYDDLTGVGFPRDCQPSTGAADYYQFTAMTGQYVGQTTYNHVYSFLIYRSAYLVGDPHFSSFSGGRFDVTGKPGHYYNVITTSDFMWNLKFIARHGKASRGTTGGDCGFRLGNTSAVITSNWRVMVNDVPRKFQYGSCVIAGPDNVCFLKVYRKIALVATPCFQIRLMRAVKSANLYRSTASHPTVRTRADHIDFIARQLAACQAHGLMGQTSSFKERVAPRGFDGEGVIAGNVTDYEIKSLLDYSFKYNLFRV
eukprot:NODE_3154_length_1269_cov_53.138743_g2995_i0.p1 GENE.NODE_3154_length_1269_cov_53.138743_g2995_i0~~NODE_3154_length_1269_cov_53.138743_g2995_i0.p1  ORF type:complete len:290 (+),score=24.71 NODE_3154_length_1269_cov_53.138743_g2995_i0:150-1019(+)